MPIICLIGIKLGYSVIEEENTAATLVYHTLHIDEIRALIVLINTRCKISCWCSFSLFKRDFSYACRRRRQPEHVMFFFLAEMGTRGSLAGQQRLAVKERFALKIFDGILRRYMSQFCILFAAAQACCCCLDYVS